MQHDNVIHIEALHKNFGDFAALRGLHLQVGRGEVHGFLGPNGSGKSTTIRILLGLMHANKGTVQVFGQDPRQNAATLHKQIAYIPGEVNLWPNLTGGEVIEYFSQLRGKLQPKKLSQLFKDFQLDPTKKCRAYSKGNRQKVAIVAALAADVDLYIMDEPTSGLDPLMEVVFQDYVQRLRSQGKSILLSSHILAEAETLCDRITIIRRGQTIETGSLAQLRHLTHLSIAVETEKPLTGFKNVTGIHDLEVKGHHATFQAAPTDLDAILQKLTQHGVRNLVSNPPSLEQLFMRHYHETDAPKRASKQ